MMAPLGNRQRRVEMDLLLLDPLRFLDDESRRAGGMGVDLAALNGNINFRTGKAGHELGIFQTDEISDHAPRDIDRVTHRVGAESETAGGAEFGESIQPQFPLGIENIRIAAIGRARGK